MALAETQSALSRWIGARHLEADAIAAVRQTLLSERYAVLDDFLVGSIAERTAQFLENEVAFRDIVNIAKPGRRVGDEEWATIAEADKIERTRVCPVVLPQFRMTPNIAAFLQLRTALRSSEMGAFMSSLCAEEVTARIDAVGYARQMIRGDFIREHDDRTGNRVASLIVHLSRNWDPAHGGALRIKRGGEYVEIPTGWNRAVIMKVDGILTHSVSDITGPGRRLTIQNWFVKD